MIIDSKSMDPPPPPYLPPAPPPFSASPVRSTLRTQRSTFSTLPAHILLQIVYSTFPQSDGRYDGQSKLERQRENLHWMVTSLRLVNKAVYIASMHILRSTYIPAYDSLIRPPYTSDPFPCDAVGSHSLFVPNHRELITLDKFIALLAHEDLYLDATSLHLPREEAYKDLFDLAQPRSRLEDLIREEGGKAGLIYTGERPPPSSAPPATTPDDSDPRIMVEGTQVPEASTQSTCPLPPSPSASPTKAFFNPFSKSSYLALAKDKIRRRSVSKTPPSPQTPIFEGQKVQHQPNRPYSADPEPLPFAQLSVLFSPRKVGLVYTITSATAGSFQGRDFGALSLSITGPKDGGRTLKKTLVEVSRPREEKLEVTAKRVVRSLREALLEDM